MKCSSPDCRADIPDDSVFCDHCGTRQPIDAANGNTKIPGSVTSNTRVEATFSEPSTSRADAATAFAGRPMVPMNTAVLSVLLQDGTRISVPPGTVLGRSEGPLSIPWADAALVSSRHGRIELNAGQWSYTDLYSSNGSSLNGHYVRPGKAVAIQSGDILLLGNKSIVVV